MSNFKCKECGTINIACGKEGYKTPKEIELEKQLKEQSEKLKAEFLEIKQQLQMEKYRNYSLNEQIKEQDEKIHHLEFELDFKERALKSARKQNGTYWSEFIKNVVRKILKKIKRRNKCQRF